MEDIKRTENETQEEKTELSVVTDSDTEAPQGAYVHELKKPFVYEDKTYTKFVFDFENLIGEDLVEIENEMAAVGEYALSPEISTSFLYRMAAKAAGVGSDVIAHLPIGDFGRIKNKSRDFLISTGY